MNTDVTLNKKEMGFFKQLILYTLLFLIGSVLVYGSLILTQITLLRGNGGNIDGIAQIYPSYTTIKHLIEALSAGGEIDEYTWSYGLGGSVFDILKSRLFIPFTYLITWAPQPVMDVVYSLVTLLKEYFCGVAFLFFGREVKLRAEQNILGAYSYAFSAWVIRASLAQDSFTVAAILLPLLIMGTDRILKGKSPLIFILSVFFYVVSGVLWAYIAGIVIIVYFVMRYPAYYGKRGICTLEGRKSPGFISTFGSFLGYGIIGMLLSAMFVISIFYTMGDATTELTYNKYELLYSIKTYLLMPTSLFSFDTAHTPYSFIFAGILVTTLLPLILLRLHRSTASLMTFLLLALSLIPFTGSFFDGFSYSVGRWFFVLIFFMVWSAMENYSHEVLGLKRAKFLLILWFLALGLFCAGWLMFHMHMVSHDTAWQTLAGLACMFVLLIVMFIKDSQAEKEGPQTHRFRTICTLIIVAVICGDLAFVSFTTLEKPDTALSGALAKVGEVEADFAKSSQRVGVQLQEEDTDFYRIDQVDGYSDERLPRTTANETLYYGTRSPYLYSSAIKSTWLKFNKVIGNNSGYFRRNLSYSTDQRTMLDYLLGVRYYLGDNVALRSGATNYMPYGYEMDRTIGGVDVYKSKYCMGLGTTFPGYITESELMAYPIAVREQVLMQTAVVPDKTKADLTGLTHTAPSTIKTNARELEAEIVNVAQPTELKGDVTGGSMTIYKEGADFDIEIPEVKDCQLMITFENFRKVPISYEENLALSHSSQEKLGFDDQKFEIHKTSYRDNTQFTIQLDNGTVQRNLICDKGHNQGLSDVTDFTTSFGYYTQTKAPIHVRIAVQGKYKFDAIHVYAVPMKIYEKAAQKQDARRYWIDKFDGDEVIGTVESDEESLLYLSILSDRGWNAYIDDKKAPIIRNTNIAFTGLKVPAGTHEVRLKYTYPGLIPGLAATFIGLLLLFMTLRYYHRRRKEEKQALKAAALAAAEAEAAAAAEAQARAEKAKADIEARAAAESETLTEKSNEWVEVEAESPAEAPAESPTATSADASAEGSAEEPAEAQAEAPAEAPAEGSAEAPMEELSEKPIEEAAQEAVDALKELINESNDMPVKEPSTISDEVDQLSDKFE